MEIRTKEMKFKCDYDEIITRRIARMRKKGLKTGGSK